MYNNNVKIYFNGFEKPTEYESNLNWKIEGILLSKENIELYNWGGSLRHYSLFVWLGTEHSVYQDTLRRILLSDLIELVKIYPQQKLNEKVTRNKSTKKNKLYSLKYGRQCGIKNNAKIYNEVNDYLKCYPTLKKKTRAKKMLISKLYDYRESTYHDLSWKRQSKKRKQYLKNEL